MVGLRRVSGRALRAAAMISIVLIGHTSCRRAAPTTPPAVAYEPDPIRDVRVLIVSDAPRVRLRADARLQLMCDETESPYELPGDAWHVFEPSANAALRITGHEWSGTDCTVRVETDAPISVSVFRKGAWGLPNRYPGAIRVSVDSGHLELINLVDTERYVAGVVAREIWPTFDREAYRAQAIVARSFVLHEMIDREYARYDIASTQGAQVYRGLRLDETGRRAARAADHTRGVVVTSSRSGAERLVCTYYSAACGGMSQSAAIFGLANDIEPLGGGVRCDHCKIAPAKTYRWGPVRMTLTEVRSRLAARFSSMRSVQRIDSIEVTDRTPSGRPVRVRVTDASGQSWDLLAERFRLAIGWSTMRSTDCSIRVAGDFIVLKNGRGFGHGLGLCQWGMEGLARSGQRAGAIVRYYFPGSNLTRVY